MNYFNLSWKDVSILANQRNWEILKDLYNKQMNDHFVYYSEIINSSISNTEDLKEGLKELSNEGYTMEIPVENGGTYVILTVWGTNSFVFAKEHMNCQ